MRFKQFLTEFKSKRIQAERESAVGRSMMEMLGTLAIMGVLSVGGIAGYNYAVVKYRANETMDELNKRAVVCVAQLENGASTLTNGEFGNKTALGYGASVSASEDRKGFNITLNGVPAEVCVQLLKNYTVPLEITVNGTKYDDTSADTDACGDENADMVFMYQQNLSNQRSEPETTVPIAYDCSWTGWLDSGKPNYTQTGGETESLTAFVKKVK